MYNQLLKKMKPENSNMNKLPEKVLNFKDFLVVDYTQQAGNDIDPDGILAYKNNKRKKLHAGGGPSESTTKKK